MRRRGSHPSTRLGSSSRPSVSPRGSVLGAFVPQGLALLSFPGTWAVLIAASLALGASSNNAGLWSSAAAPRPSVQAWGVLRGEAALVLQQLSRLSESPSQAVWTLGEKEPRLLLPHLCPTAWRRRARLLRGEWPVYKACTVLPSPSYTPAFPSPSPQDAKVQPGPLTHLVLALHLIHKDTEAQRG